MLSVFPEMQRYWDLCDDGRLWEREPNSPGLEGPSPSCSISCSFMLTYAYGCPLVSDDSKHGRGWPPLSWRFGGHPGGRSHRIRRDGQGLKREVV